MNKNIKQIGNVFLYFSFFFTFGNTAHTQRYYASVYSTAFPPMNPYIQDAFGKMANGITVKVQNDTVASFQTVYLIGKLEGLSPKRFAVSTILSSLIPQSMASSFLPGNSSIFITSQKIFNDAFGNFNPANLSISGLSSIEEIKDGNKIKLPPGQYRVCFAAFIEFIGNFRENRYISNPNMGCAFFNICQDIAPPQFTQPMSSTLTINTPFFVVQPTPVVNFAWTPPMASCGSPGPVNYELEIREILNNQTAIDALNNPYVFRKLGIPSTTFLLDLNLYQDVLQAGKKYAIRVRAYTLSANAAVVFDNGGYSRVEAFQFGSEAAVTPNPVWNPQLYFIPLTERKSNFWDDYETRRGRDTLVPIEEYIAYKLMQQGVAYNLDAIELLLSLNPELKDQKMVKLYQPFNLPVVPAVPDKLEKEFEMAHANNIKPDNGELALFRKYLDSLKKTNKVPEMFINEFNELRRHLDQFSSQAPQLNRVSLDLVNVMLSELLFSLRKSTGNMTNGEHNHLRSLSLDIKAISVIPSSSSFFNIDSSGKDLASGFSKSFVPVIYSMLSSYPYYANQALTEKAQRYFYAITDQLIPLNIVVYRPVSPPAKPIFDAPDLKGVFRIFYTTKNLYNNRNPEINAKSPGPLASTTQVSLPGRIDYKLWTLNMLTHKTTLPQDIDINELFSNNQKKDLKGKKLTVFLKVE